MSQEAKKSTSAIAESQKSTVKSELSESSVKKVANGMGLYDKRCNYKIIFS
jgi:hypothetical protein